jgi:hypothetical protein
MVSAHQMTGAIAAALALGAGDAPHPSASAATWRLGRSPRSAAGVRVGEQAVVTSGGIRPAPPS